MWAEPGSVTLPDLIVPQIIFCFLVDKKTVANEHCPKIDNSISFLSEQPTFSFNHPKTALSAAIIELMFSGDHLDKLQNKSRNLKIEVGESQCAITYVSSHAVSCEIRDANWTGLAAITITRDNETIPCVHCSFKLLSSPKTKTHILPLSAKAAGVKSDWLMILIPALTAAVLLCVILAFQIKLSSTTKQTYESLVQIRKRFFARGVQQRLAGRTFVPQNNSSFTLHEAPYRSSFREQSETDEEHFYFEITERSDSSPADAVSSCYEVPITFQRLDGIDVKNLKNMENLSETPEVHKPPSWSVVENKIPEGY
jgi:IPT/TIG domain